MLYCLPRKAILERIKVDKAWMLKIIKNKRLSHRLLEIKITENLGMKYVSSPPRIKGYNKENIQKL